MKKEIRFFAILVFGVLLICMLAMGVSGVGISDCGNLSSANTVYTLSASFTNTTVAESCLNITAENITLNCQGNSISTPNSSKSIYFSGINSISILNCVFNQTENIGSSISIGYSNNSKIINNSFSQAQIGIAGSYVNNNIFANNTFFNQTNHGIFITFGINNTLINNSQNGYFGNCNDGIWLVSSDSNLIMQNTVSYNNDYGILLSDSSNNTLLENIASNNLATASTAGISIYKVSGLSEGNIILGNTLINNNYGFEHQVGLTDGEHDNYLGGNIFINNSKVDLFINLNGANLRSFNNTFYNCSSKCIFVQNSNNNLFDSEVIKSSKDTVILVQGTSYNATNNTFQNIQMSSYRLGINVTQLVLATKFAEAIMINTSFGNYSVKGLASNALLYKQWWYTANTSRIGDNIKIYNSSGSLYQILTTGIGGGIGKFPLSEYIFSSSILYLNNWTTSFGSTNFSHNLTLENNIFDNFPPEYTVPPSIIILSPQITTYETHLIDFNVFSNHELSSCILSLNNFTTNYTLSLNASLTGANYTTSISNGVYSLIFWCNDTSGNINTSSILLSVFVASPVDDENPPGGNPPYWIYSKLISDKSFKNGYTALLKPRERVFFDIGKERHYAGIIGIASSAVLINVSSKPQQVSLDIGEEKKLELNEDKFYDLSIKLNSIAAGKANVTLLSIHEKIPADASENSGQQNEDKTKKKEQNIELNFIYLYLASILIMVVVFLVGYRIYLSKHGSKKSKHKSD